MVKNQSETAPTATYQREKSVKMLKMLSVEAINAANSGHPGIALGAAAMTYALFSEHLNCNPQDPQWINRDRFILSAGHGSALLYSVLHLSNYDISINEIKNFRQLDAVTAGHPEVDILRGIEATTGPLGQGLAMGVGSSLVASFLANRYNKPQFQIFDYYTYVVCSDGDLQEGISQEVISLAGHLKLKNLIVLYDSNDIQLDETTNIAQSDNYQQRFLSANWNYILVEDGNDFSKVSAAIAKAKSQQDQPTLIEIKTIIGVDSPLAGTSKVHGAPLGKNLEQLKQNLKWDYEPFFVPEDVRTDFEDRVFKRGQKKYLHWQTMWTKYQNEYPQDYEMLMKFQNQQTTIAENDFKTLLSSEPMATRDCSGKVLEIISNKVPLLLGGSADLTASTKAKGADGYFLSNNLQGRNIMFGVREFGMAAISNGMLLQKLVRTFVATFLVFSDYMKPAIRLAALMKIPNIFIFSHDSIAVGEDGPTHQPIEQIAMLRATPNLAVFRPCDMKETIASYIYAFNSTQQPTTILLSRQALPQIATTTINEALKGAYIVKRETTALKLIIIATGSEVQLALKVEAELAAANYKGIRVVSMPAPNVFDQQPKAYQEKILPPEILKVSIEMAATWGWHKYVANGLAIGIDQFGISGPMDDVMTALGFTVTNITLKIKAFLDKNQR